jgi:hypothetical protein
MQKSKKSLKSYVRKPGFAILNKQGGKMKRTISLFLVASVLLLSMPLAAKERKGADVIVQKKEGIQVRGELIAVKAHSLLLLERESGGDVTVDIDDISGIRIVKKSKILIGGGLGAIICGGGLWLYGSTQSTFDFYDNWPILALVAAGGLVIGGIIGAVVGIDRIIQTEGKPDAEIQKILEKLRKKARVKNAQ